jgi:SAM-dependent methyltransferase
MSGMAFFRERMAAIRYLGADISDSVDVAAMRAKEFGYEAALLQCDLNELPLLQQSVDVVFSEGVLHHTDNTQKALEQLVQHLKPLGRVMFYVYRVKGPIREFTDDYIRSQLSNLEPDAVWKALEPLTALGVQLGELGIELDIAKPIDLLGIPAGKIDLQRFFYWHVFKAFYRPEMSFDEMQHVNFDWYAPANARRHSPEEVRVWCEKLNLYIEHEHLEEAGITIVARKRG